MKKKCAYLLIAALSVSMLAGCGSKKSSSSSSKSEVTKGSKVEVSMEDVLENVAEAAIGIESVKIDVSGVVDVQAEADGQKMTAKGDVSFSGNMVKEEPAFDFEGSASYSADIAGEKMEDELKVAAYGETDGKDLKVYASDNGSDWEVSTLKKSEFEDAFAEIEDALEEMQTSLSDLSADDLKDIEKFVKLENTTKKLNGSECYVLAMTINKDTIEEIMKYSGDILDEDMEEEAETYTDMLSELDKFEVTASLYFDKDTYLPARISLEADVDGEVEGVSVKVNECSLEMNLQVNGDIEAEEVPEDVKENAVEADNYDYDYDDEDEDGEEDVEDETTSKKNNKKSEDDENYTAETTTLPKSIKIEGTEIAFPSKYETAEKLGLVVDESYSDMKVSSDSYGLVYLEKKDDEYSYLTFSVYNSGAGEAEYKDCDIIGIMIDDSFDWELDNGVKIGDTFETVKKKYEGVKPSYVYEGDYHTSYSYEDENGNEITFDFEVDTEKLYQVDFKLYE